MLTVIAVLVLAVVGTGAAYAYRTYAGSARTDGAPPVIKADAGPNKIVPQQAGSGDAVGKLIQDRMSTDNGTEQMVSREEQPVDVKEATNSGPRVVFPSLNQNANPPQVASVAPNVRPPATVANGTIAGDEPRKIKTLTVHGDQADLAAGAVVRPAHPAAPASAPAAGRHTPPSVATVHPRRCRCPRKRLPNRGPGWLRPIRASSRLRQPQSALAAMWFRSRRSGTRRTHSPRSGCCRANSRPYWDREPR